MVTVISVAKLPPVYDNPIPEALSGLPIPINRLAVRVDALVRVSEILIDAPPTLLIVLLKLANKLPREILVKPFEMVGIISRVADPPLGVLRAHSITATAPLVAIRAAGIVITGVIAVNADVLTVLVMPSKKHVAATGTEPAGTMNPVFPAGPVGPVAPVLAAVPAGPVGPEQQGNGQHGLQ